MGFSGSGRTREAAPGAAWVAAARVRSFGISGFQGGLLRQLDCFHRRRGPTIITLKPGRQLTLPNLDQHPPGRPAQGRRRRSPVSAVSPGQCRRVRRTAPPTCPGDGVPGRCCRRYEEGAEASLANRRGLPKANAMDRWCQQLREASVFRQRTFVGLDVHARSVVGHAMDEHTGEVWQRLLPVDPPGVWAGWSRCRSR
jgi:hypothetical protein